MAAAIVADAAAFMLWSLASRSPAQLARDLSSGLTRPAVAAVAVLRFAAGLLLLAAGAVLLLPIAIGSPTFTVLETWTVLTGLLVEVVLGTGRTRPKV